jgi:hypothetical protein
MIRKRERWLTAEDIACRSSPHPLERPGDHRRMSDPAREAQELPLLRARWAREDREERRRGGIRALAWEVLAVATLVGAFWWLLTR